MIQSEVACELSQIPGKGLGLIASQDISSDEVILFPDDLILNSLDNMHQIMKAFDELSQEKKLELLMLANKSGDTITTLEEAHKVLSGKQEDLTNKVKEIVNTNSWEADEEEETDPRTAVYNKTSRLNHSCEPTCVLVPDGKDVRLYVIQAIAKGQELTISYFGNPDAPYAERVSFLQQWGFACTCDKCLFASEQTHTRPTKKPKAAAKAGAQERHAMRGSRKRKKK